MNRSPINDTAHPPSTLSRALRALAEEEARVEPPAHLEDAVLARWDAAHTRRSRMRGIVRGAATLAAGVTLFGAFVVHRELDNDPLDLPVLPTVPIADLTTTPPALLPTEPVVTARFVRGTQSQAKVSTLVLVGQPLAAGEIVHVVRMRVDRASLAALGVTGSSSADVVDVDVLVGEDGVARGLRVAL